MKRIIAKFVVAGLLASGAAVVAASPSSAQPRDPCMDEVNWWEMMASLDLDARNAWNIYDGWASATIYFASTGPFYVAQLPYGAVQGSDLNALSQKVSVSYSRWVAASDQALNFYNNVAMC